MSPKSEIPSKGPPLHPNSVSKSTDWHMALAGGGRQPNSNKDLHHNDITQHLIPILGALSVFKLVKCSVSIALVEEALIISEQAIEQREWQTQSAGAL